MWWPGHIELVPLPSCLQKPQHHLVPSALADHDHGLLLELCGSYHVTNSCRELGPAAVMVHELVLASSIAHSGHIAMDICVARQTITRFLLFVQLDALVHVAGQRIPHKRLPVHQAIALFRQNAISTSSWPLCWEGSTTPAV